MKAVMISIKPKYVALIANGQKTIEVQKTRPKINTPFKCYIYCTKGDNLWLTQKGVKSKTELAGYLMNGKVIGEFVCDWITEINPHCDMDGCVNQYIHGYPAILGDDCLSFNEMKAYLGNKKGYDWHISDLVIYDEPKEVGEFVRPCDRFLDCITCKRLVRNDYLSCDNKIIRPPKSWCYVEEKE